MCGALPELGGGRQTAGEAEVAHFNIPVTVDEDVLWFQIPV